MVEPVSDSAAAAAASNSVSKSRKRKKSRKPKDELGTEVGGFTIVGVANQSQNKHAKRVLPYWLANPTVISSDLRGTNASIKSVGLDTHIIKTLEQNYIQYLFPVQTQIIPWLVQVHTPKLFRPSDLCVSAPTGSGKTLAYVLPIVQILRKYMCPRVRAIIVLPTQVLANQVFTVISTYCKGTNLKVFLMSKNLTMTAERKALTAKNVKGECRTPFDIIISTPGRLVDHLEQTEGFDVSQLQFLVVDEADRTLDDQEGNWLHRLEVKFWSNVPTGISQPWKSIPMNQVSMGIHLQAFQKLLFSATLSQNPETLEKLHLFQPKLFTSIVTNQTKNTANEIDGDDVEADTAEVNSQATNSVVGKYVTPRELEESFVLCRKDLKPLTLFYLISKNKWKRVLCFVNTKEGTHRLCMLLKFMGDLKVRSVSSQWSPRTLELTLKMFANGSVDVLVTTDQMARGIDIPMVDHVISYDLPGYTKSYIHRIGRTARAGHAGAAICLVEKEQMGIFRKTMKAVGKVNINRLPVKNSDLKPFELNFKNSLEKVKLQVLDGSKKTKKSVKETADDTAVVPTLDTVE